MVTHRKLTRSLGPALDSVLCPEGFQRDSNCIWRRVRNSVLSCVELQIRSDGGAFCVNLGVHFEFLPIAAGTQLPDLNTLREPECELRTRLERDGQEVWWTDPAQDANDVALLLASAGLEFFERYADVQASLGVISPDSLNNDDVEELTRNLTRSRRLLLLARVHEYLEKPEWARTIAQLGLSENPPTGPKVQFTRLLKRLGE